jgi:hypothetical protein
MSMPISEMMTFATMVEDRSLAHAHDVRDDRGDLEVGVLQSFLDPLDVLRLLAHELLAGAGERAQLLDRRWRHEAAANQPVGE